ncbi:NAD(P)-binding domain-containing protein [Bradyrhizobium acaciae]|uniref:NAD(P)-binding domain-containing protein n=1 Tax=Bradyrhizobium acaciae TaxID=2683706 RepID=UPI001E30CFD0|nr:NAD(P)-binding domain-containing protein [Bradyrhizobium acaciae]MCC8984861.1 NAD(P)-binding domain-containing protein [Bradyrhizobium acaciae]
MPVASGKDCSASPLYLDSASLKACLSDEEIYEIVSQTLREMNSTNVVKGPKAGFGFDINGDHLHMGSVCGAVLSSSAAGIKWFTVADRNLSRSLPRVPATVLVCDAETGMLQGVLNGTQLTSERTAAMAVAAASACCRRSMKKAAVVGAGAIGSALVKFLALTQPVDHIAVASLRESSARQACDAVGLALRLGLTLTPTADVSRAVRDADVVFTSTGVSKDTDVVSSEWLKKGAVVCTLGTRREVDTKLLSDAWIVVDDADGIRLRRGDFREGGVGWNRIVGDIGSVMSGQLPLPPDDKKINVVLIGTGMLDVALGARAIVNARRKGLGIQLERQ